MEKYVFDGEIGGEKYKLTIVREYLLITTIYKVYWDAMLLGAIYPTKKVGSFYIHWKTKSDSLKNIVTELGEYIEQCNE